MSQKVFSMTETELKEQGAVLACRVGVQSRPVYELDGGLYEKQIENDETVAQFTLVTDPGHAAWLRTWRAFRGT